MVLYEEAYEDLRRKGIDLTHPRNSPFAKELLEATNRGVERMGDQSARFPFSRPPD
jgi:hypothetical protein